MIRHAHRSHGLWLAFILHRLSGVALALFLPVHFYVLSLALTEPARLDGFLNWTDRPLVKAAEFGLVFLLAVHIFGGLRLMALEFLPWPSRQKSFAAGAVALALFLSGGFLLSAM
ncbi:MAG: succinate dehydrogenase, cytochrome b556 subunit [Rhizobiaceae bacterium]|nr:succinate dehydrogenase, cytochrome b556 subunit [Rhizobiaceae bacterium]